MPAYYEDFHRCNECGNSTFVEKKLLTIKKVKGFDRDTESVALPPSLLEEEIVYCCSKCGQQLDI